MFFFFIIQRAGVASKSELLRMYVKKVLVAFIPCGGMGGGPGILGTYVGLGEGCCVKHLIKTRLAICAKVFLV